MRFVPCRNYFSMSGRLILKRSLHVTARSRKILALNRNAGRNQLFITQRRSIFSLVGVLRSVLKIRYIVLGSALGGGYHMNNKYQQWKESLPNFDWIKDIIPDPEKQKMVKDSLLTLKERLTADDGFLSEFSKNAQITIEQFREMLKERQNNKATDMADSSDNNTFIDTIQEIKNPFSPSSSIENKDEEYERIRKLQEELIEIQHKYQKEIERLESENRELRKSIMLKADKATTERLRKVNKTLIDLYSDVLDELNDYDSNYNTQDHLPRVIVVGDQSAGKTSVLEMIAHARIFPRGAGEMMTRSPVKVTLKEGPYHVASFKDINREYDLTKEHELADLRREIELRMKSRVKGGQTVSKDVISLSVEGPGIPRMVLIDLPGVISTVTTEMASDTRQAIEEISKTYMNNPNAIILCVQDGSVDAERSIVTDLVSQVDPSGKRTIFVMTKIDLAEHNMSNPSRLKKILEGKLFPMKALGYFAVVTGRGGKDDTIKSIKEYEESFFKNSKLCKQGILNASQCTTQSLSLAVSDCFWKMVKSSVEQQADLYKARKFNLETEWKNTFSRYRELDRDELFEKGKNQILDQIIKLSHLNDIYWEDLIFKKLNESFKDYIFENIYLPSAEMSKTENFNIMVDIKLKDWIDKLLPSKTVEVGWQVLSEQFVRVLNQKDDSCQDEKHTESDYNLFRNLKSEVAKEVLDRHQWDSKANDVLKLIQINASEDRMILHKEKWKESAKYLQDLIKDRISLTQCKLRELVGPGWTEQWLYWKSITRDQYINANIKNELDQIINFNNIKPSLDSDELLLVKKNLKAKKIEVLDEDINALWSELYNDYFLNTLLFKAQNCEKLYPHYKYKLDSDISCDDVIFFYRIHNILQASSKALRQQIMNIERQRLNREVKETLDDFNQETDKKSGLITGKRVSLAEELKRVRRIQDKLEEFIEALNKEK